MLSKLKDTASVWVFQANSELSVRQMSEISSALSIFIPQWAAHGVSLRADFEIVNNLFIVVGVDEDAAKASGCSKDALTREIKAIGTAIGIDFFDRMKTAFINANDKIELCDMLTFKKLVSEGVITEQSIVFNNLIANKSELLTVWKTPVSDSWHNNLLSAV